MSTSDTSSSAEAAEASLANFDGETIMTITDSALETVMGIRGEEPKPDEIALRVHVTGAKGVEYIYDLSFEDIAAIGVDHHGYKVKDLAVAIPTESVDKLRGAELDLSRAAGQGGLVIRNPNRADPFAGIDVELTGEVADKVSQLLDQSINPMLASHGGFATLVGVDDENNVYVTMGGGCQGCSASAATLTDGIQRSIKEAIPEVAAVIDATDHSAGENPFYN